MAYTRPGDVRSPQSHLTLVGIVDEGAEGTSALAVGIWEEVQRGKPRSRPVLLMRWNGYDDPQNDESEVGVPSSRGYATWFVIEERYNEAILGSGLLDPERVEFARQVLGRRRRW